MGKKGDTNLLIKIKEIKGLRSHLVLWKSFSHLQNPNNHKAEMCHTVCINIMGFGQLYFGYIHCL